MALRRYTSPWGTTSQSALQKTAPQPDRDQPSALQPQNLIPRAGSLETGMQTSFGPPTATQTPGTGFTWPTPEQSPYGQLPANLGLNPKPIGAAPIATGGGAGGGADGPGVDAPPASTNIPAGNKGSKGTSLEMNPHYQQGMAALDAELASILTEAGVAEKDLEAQIQLIKARLGLSHQELLRRTDESANERGIYNSGIRNRDRGYVDMEFDQKYQDTQIDRIRGLRELASLKGRAFANRNRGLADLALRIAELLAADPGMDVPTTGEEGFSDEPQQDQQQQQQGGLKRSGWAKTAPKKRFPGKVVRY